MDEVLRRAGLFQGVDPADVEALGSQFEVFDAPRGTTLFNEGEPGDSLYIVLSGKVKLGRKSSDGRENLVAVMGPADQFGELSLFDPGPAHRHRGGRHRRPGGPAAEGRADRLDHRAAGRSRCSCCGWWPAGCAGPTPCWPT